jgi:hypothetical protein
LANIGSVPLERLLGGARSGSATGNSSTSRQSATATTHTPFAVVG